MTHDKLILYLETVDLVWVIDLWNEDVNVSIYKNNQSSEKYKIKHNNYNY